jgi:energy-converting hydrogenase Eha subunit B
VYGSLALFCGVLCEPNCREYGNLAFFVVFYMSQIAGGMVAWLFFIVGNPNIGAKKTYPF